MIKIIAVLLLLAILYVSAGLLFTFLYIKYDLLGDADSIDREDVPYLVVGWPLGAIAFIYDFFSNIGTIFEPLSKKFLDFCKKGNKS